jgi:hypothetical protein
VRKKAPLVRNNRIPHEWLSTSKLECHVGSTQATISSLVVARAVIKQGLELVVGIHDFTTVDDILEVNAHLERVLPPVLVRTNIKHFKKLNIFHC